MIKKKHICTAFAIITSVVVLGLSAHAEAVAGDITGGVEAPHVNIAIFHKLHGQESFVYPEHVDEGNILQSFKGKAQFISINHTAGLKDGDVITIANDVLRDGGDGGFEDYGVDCQLAVNIKDENVSLAGICQIFMVDKNHREIKHKGLVKLFSMKPNEGWTLIYYNAEDGIGVYADEEIGLE